MKDKGINGKPRGKFVAGIIVILLYSLALPFFLGVVYAGINGVSFGKTFSDVYRYFVLAGVMFAILFTVESYIFFRRKDLTGDGKQLGVILISLTLCYLFAIIFGNFISLFSMPLLLFGLIIALLVDKRLALFSNIMFSIAFFLCYITVEPAIPVLQCISAILTQAVTSSLMISIMSKSYTRMTFIKNALLVGAFMAAPVAILTGLLQQGYEWMDILMGGVWAFISVLLGVALFMIVLPVIEDAFGMYSDFKLEEICSPDAKLMKRLAKEAPGTYNHSLAVGNLAEICAIKIGENPALAKAGAYYHDVGKLKNPLCFTENQNGYNPHDDFIPEVSVYMITDHVTYGAELIKKYKLPTALADIAKEHHGTTPVQYFLNKAKSITDEQLAREQFCYHGPKPQTKISGLIMIVDTVEAATRAMGADADSEKLREFIHKLIDSKVSTGQFTECPFTFKDLQDIEDTLVATLPSLYHQRIKYVKDKK
ncbi:MAG: HDIG domain-containing protein [Clostridiales bacterium]|nr:HDIG domain-containing protein [Clostridiales bacterium]